MSETTTKTAEEMAQEAGNILSVATVNYGGDDVFVVVDSDSGNIVSEGLVLYETEEVASDAMVTLARSFASTIETRMGQRTNKDGVSITKGAWPKAEKVAFLRYQNVYLERERQEEALNSAIELLRSRGRTEEEIQSFLSLSV